MRISSLVRASPLISAKRVRALPTGIPTPTPYLKLSGRSNSLGSPRTMKPPYPASSAAPRSLLTTASKAPSTLPVEVPALFDPVGNFAMARTANATGARFCSEVILNFPPIRRSPTSLEKYSFANGSWWVGPPMFGSPLKIGLASLSTRVSARNEPKISTLSFRP